MSRPSTVEPNVPPWTRRFVYGFLGLLLLCGFASIEAWPFSAFKLFSSMRSDERASWQIVWVDPQDREETISLRELPVAYRNTATLLREFDAMTPDQRDDVCDAWAKPSRDLGRSVQGVRIYRNIAVVGPDPPRPSQELMWECGR